MNLPFYEIIKFRPYESPSRERRLADCIDDVRARFGKHTIHHGRALVRAVRRVA